MRKLLIATLSVAFLLGDLGLSTTLANAAPDNAYKTGSGDAEAAYLNGTYVQASIAKNGRFGSPTAAPTIGGVTWHPSGGRANIGFVADRNRDNTWLDTDFFYPGTPFEGWGLNFGGTEGQFSSGGTAAGATFSFGDVDVTASSTSVTHTTTWGDFTIAQTYSARKGTGAFVKDQQLDISVRVTNNSAAAIGDVSYVRVVDPDNLTDALFGHSTTNRIVSQYGVNGKNYSLVSARRSDTRQTPAGNSYLGLISSDARSKVSSGGFGWYFGSTDFRTWFTDSAGASASTFETTVNEEDTGDIAMQILFTLGTIAAGASTTFDLSYVLSVDSASDTAGEDVGIPSTPTPVIIPSSLVTFAQNGADTSSLPQSEVLNDTKALWKNPMSRAGYIFNGWNTKADGTGTAYADGAIFKFDLPNIMLYAQWKLIQTKPTIIWATPSPIQEGIALNSTQLNAVGSVPGTYTYSPAAASVPAVGKQVLKVTYVPTDAKYETIEATVEIEVLAKAKVTWANPASIVEGTALSSAQLNASASVPGIFTYEPKDGALLTPGKYTLKVTFAPTDSRLSPVTAEVTLEVTAKPVVIPAAPVSPTYSVSGSPKTTITWGAGKDAATYTVLVDGKNACSVAALTCEVATLLGPKNVVTVTSVATGGKTSAAVPAAYVAPAASQVLAVVNFDTAKSVIKATESAKLRAFAATIKAAGYTTLTVYGHTDSVSGIDNQKLSVARANATIAYLKKLLPGVTFVVSGFAASAPVADNSTAEGKAANRRAEIFIP